MLGQYSTPDTSWLLTDATTVPEPVAAPAGVSSSDWISAITDSLPKISAFLNAQQLAQVNIERARRGYAPLDTAAYGPQVGVSLTPQTQQYITYGLLALAALILLPKVIGGRR